MNLSELISQMYDSSTPLDTFRALREAPYQTTSTKAEKAAEFETALNTLADALKKDKVRKALSITRALLLTSSNETISRIRKYGILRCSRYEYRERAAQAVVHDMLQNATIYGLTQTHRDYLQSVDNLLSLGGNLQRERAFIVKRLRDKEVVVIKTLLANVEAIFTNGLPGDRSLSTDSPYAYVPEDMAEAFSYLLTLFQTCIGLKEKHFVMADDSNVEKNFYVGLLVDAAKMCEFKAAEVLIDSFPYRATVDGRMIKVESIDTLLEKSIRIGYMQASMQINVKNVDMHREEHSKQSMTRSAKELFVQCGDALITLDQNPIARYVMRLPDDQQLFKPFSGNHLFLEDLVCLNMLGKEDYITADAAIELPVVGNITVFDILIVQRFFRFTHQCFKEAFNQHPIEADRAKIQFRSCIQAFTKKDLLLILNHLLPGKAEEILALLTCDPAISQRIDLQYMPIIRSQDRYMLSPAVLASSNLVRNLLCYNGMRLTLRDKTKMDPMQAALAETLKNAGFLVEIEMERKVVSKQLEIDILAYRDGHLFIFECKNAYHPCNVYEMLNSYKHITKAAEQLERQKLWLLDPTKQQKLFNSLKWNNAVPTNQVITCIAIGNRVFNGYECAGHPVRHIHELLNVLKSGEIVIDGEIRRIWKNSSFSINDLLAHLAGDTIIADFLQVLQPINHQYKFGSKVLSLASYSLDTTELTKIVKSRYPFIEAAKSEADD